MCSAYTVTTDTRPNAEIFLKEQNIVFRVSSPENDATQGQRAYDYCEYLNLLEERNKELTITGAIAQRLLKEKP